MPQFVTRIPISRRAAAPATAQRTYPNDRVRMNDAYSRRLAALRTRAPDTLCARVRRELRAAGESITRPE